MSDALPPDVQVYLDEIAAEHRPMWDRVAGLVRGLHPEVERRITYGMPTFVVGEHRLPVGVWTHGLSLYGLNETNDAGFIARRCRRDRWGMTSLHGLAERQSPSPSKQPRATQPDRSRRRRSST